MNSGPRILCVDDEPIIRMVVCEILTEIGCAVVQAESGEDALVILEDGGIDLLVTDIRMNGMSGWDLAERARALQPDLPVIYVSGYTSENRRLSNTLFLAKPFLPQQLRTAVKACVAQARPAEASSKKKGAAEPCPTAPHDRLN